MHPVGLVYIAAHAPDEGGPSCIRGLRETLAAVAAEGEAMLPFVDHMSRYVEAIDLRGLMAELERVSEVVP